MHDSVMAYLKRAIGPDDVAGKSVLEVGSYDVNGSPRTVVGPLGPAWYVGVDMTLGPGVDAVCPADALVDKFGEGAFDLVISTEMLEHVLDWKAVVSNLKRVVRPWGLLVVTTRSPGFPYHAYPVDFWRYTIPDFRWIFSDMEIVDLMNDDPSSPGILFKARKPETAVDEVDLTRWRLVQVDP